LGPPISVGYPVDPVKTTNLSEGSASRDGDSTRFSQASESPAPQPVEFDFRFPPVETQPVTPPIPAQEQKQPVEQPAPVPTSPSTPQPQSQPSQQSPPPSTPPASRRVVELNSDRQEYDEQRQIVTAEGNALVRFDGGVLDADRIQVNLLNKIAVGEGDVALTRGQQVLRGQRFTYNIVQDSGDLLNGMGEIYLPTAGSDFSGTLPTDVTAGGVPPRPPSDRITANQPLQQVTSTGGIGVTVGGKRNVSNIPLPQQGGSVRRLRFEAEQIDFYPEGWQASNVRITNDPFSPPELELRADQVTLTRETPLRDRIKTTRQRLVFDQGLSVPIPKDETVIDRSERDVSPGLAQIGFDGDDRGGVFVERGFTPIDTDLVRVRLTPQFFAQKAVQENGGNVFDPGVYGLKAKLDATLGLRTAVTGSGVFTSLDPGEIEDNLRASLRLRQIIGTRLPHTLGLEYSYRDRLFNGSLGFQTVQSSIGGVLTSPIIPLGKSGINLSYQAGAQYINAETDRLDLLEPVRDNNRTSLSRFQGSAALSRGFLLWQGKGLPATATEGLRYTPAPVVPFLQMFGGVTGTSGFYSNGDNQTTLIGTIGLQGQVGHFSRPFLDYTSFNISYSQGLRSGVSPFLFDRADDTSVLSAGLTQQIYGPFRFGVQASLNLDTGELYNTDFILEYSRRSYGITLRYNPDLELGSLSLRISDFNWTGGSDAFSDSEVKPVVGGVRREND
jgi:lipopolysaccharide export system protein LptA